MTFVYSLNIGLRTLIVGAPATTNTPASDDSIVDEIFGIAEEEEPTPESFHLRFNRPRKPALKVDESATILLDLTNEIKVHYTTKSFFNVIQLCNM